MDPSGHKEFAEKNEKGEFVSTTKPTAAAKSKTPSYNTSASKQTKTTQSQTITVKGYPVKVDTYTQMLKVKKEGVLGFIEGAYKTVASTAITLKNGVASIKEGSEKAVTELAKATIDLVNAKNSPAATIRTVERMNALVNVGSATVTKVTKATTAISEAIKNPAIIAKNVANGVDSIGKSYNELANKDIRTQANAAGSVATWVAILYVGGAAGKSLKASNVVRTAGTSIKAADTVDDTLKTTQSIMKATDNFGDVVEGGSGDLVKVYRGTSNTAEQMIHEETGHLLSDSTRRTYMESGNLNAAYKASEATHNEWLKIWGSESNYVQAHGAFGTELPQAFGLDRTMMSVTSDKAIAQKFAGQYGKVYEALIPKSHLIPQTLEGAGESEFLIKFGTGGFQ